MSAATQLAETIQTLLGAGDVLERIPAIEDELRALRASQTAEHITSFIEEGLHPDYRYNSAQAAKFLGMKRTSVNKLPHDLIPHEGGYFLGIDIMAYRGDITYDEASAYKEAKRQTILRLIKSVNT